MISPAPSPIAAGSETRSLAIAALLAALAIAPVLFVDMPAMNDYPNHLARMELIAAIGTPEQNPYYFTVWKLYPNLAMDMIVPALERFVGIANAGRIFLVASQLLVFGGAIALERAVKGRHEFAGFAATAMLYSTPFAWGLINFEFGLGLTLLGVAAWIAGQERPAAARLAAHTAFVFAIYVSHIFALGVYGATIGLLEMSRLTQRRPPQTVALAAILAAPVAVIAIALAILGSSVGGGRTEWIWIAKLLELIQLFNGYSYPLSVVMLVVFAATTGFLIASGKFYIRREGKWIAAGFLVLFFALPLYLGGGSFSEMRLLVAAILVLAAFCSRKAGANLVLFQPGLVLSAISLVNIGATTSMLLLAQPHFAAMTASFAQVRPGAFVLVGQSYSVNAQSPFANLQYRQFPALAAHYAKAFVPSLFANAAQNPLRVCPQLERLFIADETTNAPLPISDLAAIADGAATKPATAHLTDWTRDFEYLYLIGPEAQDVPNYLVKLAGDEVFTLYRITTAARPAALGAANGVCNFRWPAG